MTAQLVTHRYSPSLGCWELFMAFDVDAYPPGSRFRNEAPPRTRWLPGAVVSRLVSIVVGPVAERRRQLGIIVAVRCHEVSVLWSG